MKLQWNKMQEMLCRELDKNRYEHTLGVMYTACCLAMAYEVNLEQARLAGLLHDCAKCIPDQTKIKLCEKAKLPLSTFEREHPFLLHAKLGAYLAQTKYFVLDPEVLNAILWHTTGKQKMSLLEKIIYIADYMEPNRNKAPNLTQVRRLAFEDLDECMYTILMDTVNYLKKKPDAMDKTTLEAYEYYKNIHDRKKEG